MTAESRRHEWLQLLLRVARPPLAALAAGRLRATMPVEARSGTADRPLYTHLEAIGRTLTGLAPWLELKTAPSGEAAPQAELRQLARAAISRGVDPASADHLNFNQGRQPVVDAAFLAQALLRAPRQLWHALDEKDRQRLAESLRSSRVIEPPLNNWLLFSATIEAALLRFTGAAEGKRIAYAAQSLAAWYKGDSLYGDGPEFHWDYYNSFVIHPMLLELLEVAGELAAQGPGLLPAVRSRAVRFAAILERLVAPDGSFPAVGRSLAYRCGAMHHLAYMALRHELPGGVSPAQARSALSAVIRRTLTAPNTFDAGGWLRIGLCGHQPDIGEPYISTGSLYLCTTAFLPLGLPATDPFWSDPDEPYTAQRVWSGQNLPADHALPG